MGRGVCHNIAPWPRWFRQSHRVECMQECEGGHGYSWCILVNAIPCAIVHYRKRNHLNFSDFKLQIPVRNALDSRVISTSENFYSNYHALKSSSDHELFCVFLH